MVDAEHGPREPGLQALAWGAAVTIMIAVELVVVRLAEPAVTWFSILLAAAIAAVAVALTGRRPRWVARVATVLTLLLGIASALSVGAALLLAAALLGLGDVVFGARRSRWRRVRA